MYQCTRITSHEVPVCKMSKLMSACIPSGKSSSTPTQGPEANSTLPTNLTTPVLGDPLEDWMMTLSPIWTQDGTGTSCNLSRSALLPKEQTLAESSLPRIKSHTHSTVNLIFCIHMLYILLINPIIKHR